MIVAVHQPNYLPWLGYFAKMVQADMFVFLDDVQFSKNSYTNRVQILNGQRRHWLTVPVHVRLGDTIDAVAPAKPNWARSHAATLANFYRHAPAYPQVWPDIQNLLATVPDADIGAVNIYLIESFAQRLGIVVETACSSAIDTGDATADLRLAEIVAVIAPGGSYLSGSGGKNYQTEATFADRGLDLRYSRFEHPSYDQGGAEFEAGLSCLDAVFRLGWSGTRDLIMASIA